MSRAGPTPPPATRIEGIYRQAARGALLKSGGLGIRFLLTFVLQVALARILFPEHFGRYALCVLVMEWLIALTDLQLGTFYIQAQDDRSRAQILPMLLVQGLVGGLAVLLLQTLAVPLTSALGWHEFGLSFRLMVLGALVTPLSRLLRSVLERDFQFVRSTVPGLVGLAVQALVSVELALSGQGELALVLGFLSKEATEFLLLLGICLAKILGVRPDFHLGPVFRYIAPLLLTEGLLILSWNVDDALVAGLLGEEALGEYYVAFRFPHYLYALGTPLVVVALTVFARLRAEGKSLDRAFETVLNLTAHAVLAASSIGVVAAPLFIQVFLGERWLPAATSMQILFVVVALRCISRLWMPLYEAHGITRKHALPMAVTCGLILLGGSLGIPLGGIEGMSLGVLAGVGLGIGIFVPRNVRALLPGVSLARALAWPLVVAGLNLLVGAGIATWMTGPGWLRLLLLVGALGVLDVGLLFRVERTGIRRLLGWVAPRRRDARRAPGSPPAASESRDHPH